MKDAEQKVVELLDKLDALATQYAPEVLDSAIRVVQVDAAGALILSLTAVILSVLIGWRLAGKPEDFLTDLIDDKPFSFTLWIMGIICSVLFLALSLLNLFDIWNWVALFDPKLALAHKILGL